MKIYCLIGLLFFYQMTPAQSSNPEKIVQANLEAYNNRNIDAFMEHLSDDVALYNFQEATPIKEGKEALRILYKNLFEQSPQLHSTILKRIVFDNKVIDHEYIVGRLGSTTPLEIILIYEIRNEKIYRLTTIRK